MSTYQLFGYNYIILPNLDIMLRLRSGKNFFINDKYVRWFALFCFLSGVRLIYTICNNLPKKILQIKNFIKNFLYSLPAPGVNKYVVIFGYGDSDAGLSILKFFSKKGYNFLLINYKKILNLRQTHELENMEEIDKLNNKIKQINYENFIEEFDNLIKNDEIFIDYIFDCSIFRVITEFQPFDSVQDQSNNSSSCLEKENLIFHTNQITSSLHQFISIFEILKMRIVHFKVFSLEYLSKSDDVNHKLLFDMKYSVIEIFLKIYKSLVKPEKICYFRKIKIGNQNNIIEENQMEKYLYENL